jgi:hypothetical protein
MPQRPSERIDDAVRKVLEAMAPKKEAAAPMCSTTSNDFTTRDLPLKFHPVAVRVSADVTPFGAV